MPSTPLIDSSSGVATVSAITLGFAPGYWARTTTEGGATSGYSEIGSPRSAIRPAISISSDSTPAKIGRSMKNLERFMLVPPEPGSGLRVRHVLGLRLNFGLRVHGHGLWRHQRARTDVLQAVDDHALARLQAPGDHAQTVDRRAECHFAVFGLVVFADHQDELLVLVGADRALV